MNNKKIKKNAAKAEQLLKALANQQRLLILCNLVDGEQTAGRLWEKSSLSQSAFSQHLAVLRRCKLVAIRKEAQTIYYSLANHRAKKVLETLSEIYCHE
ncbi:MAG: helix-turn-helix transcriptional regulator [Gammaproteobacteria bacterium]|nr:helix-turn-helix transcriptional regulator [Gammaproteobacteria bacterium]